MNLREISLNNGLSLPIRKSEDWKYSNMVGLSSIDYELINDENQLKIDASVIKDILKEYLDEDSCNIVVIDGYIKKEYSDSLEGISYNEKDELDIDFSIFTKKSHKTFFEELTDDNTQKTLNVNLKKTTKPIHFVWINGQSNTNINVKLEIHVGENIKASFRHSFIGLKGKVEHYFNNINVNILLESSSELKYEEGFFDKSGFTVIESRFQQKQNSSLDVRQFSCGSSYIRSSVYIALEESGAKCDLKGSYALGDKRMTDYFIYISHIGRETESSQLYKGLLNHQATLIFNGEVYIEKEAFKAVSDQLNHSLALSDDAKAYSRPQLDIYCDDVECGHGSAMGRLGEKEFFYIQSRGVSSKMAKKMMAMGFALDVLDDYSENFKKLIIDYLNDGYMND